jgi:ABC-2 type transport system permease protein
MSSAVATIDTTKPHVSFGRLVRVEIRKMFDTRSGFWLMLATGILLAFAIGITLLVIGLDEGTSLSASDFSSILTIPLSILLPVFAIVTVTSEWGQRSHLSLFTLEPRRSRIIGAKLVSVLVLALGTIVLAIVLGALANLVGAAIGGYDVEWNLDVSNIIWTIALQLAYFLMAFALSMVFLSSPATIVVFYIFALLLPFMVYPPLFFAFDWAQDIIPWVDFNYAASPLISGEDFAGESVSVGALEYVRFAFTLVLWIGIPGAIGLRRVLTTEVK